MCKNSHAELSFVLWILLSHVFFPYNLTKAAKKINMYQHRGYSIFIGQHCSCFTAAVNAPLDIILFKYVFVYSHVMRISVI